LQLLMRRRTLSPSRASTAARFWTDSNIRTRSKVGNGLEPPKY